MCEIFGQFDSNAVGRFVLVEIVHDHLLLYFNILQNLVR